MIQQEIRYQKFLSKNNWRLKPGYINKSKSSYESVHVLLGRFLADRHSENPLPYKSLLEENKTYEWGKGNPLEKVINSPGDLELLMKNPQLFRNCVTIIEPWEHVGTNNLGEDVRASVNAAFILQKIADCESVIMV